jgi:hypothetical protein
MGSFLLWFQGDTFNGVQQTPLVGHPDLKHCTYSGFFSVGGD